MSVVVETTLGDITVDLYLKERPRACLNFLKLCKVKYYNYNLFHTISHNFIAQTGDPTGSRIGGESIFGVLEGPLKRYFEAETTPRIKHTTMGLISFVGNEERMIGSQFFFTLSTDLTYLDEQHCVFGEVVEGMDVIELLNEVICDNDNRPYQDVRITHTVILEDPYPDPPKLRVPDRSPSPSAERLAGGRIAPDEEIDETVGKSYAEINEMIAEREAKARATILEMVGDIPDAEMAPPENVLFVCKLNPVTTDEDLEIIFSRFGKIKSCEVIRDKKTGDSLQYAFVEFEDQKACEDAYFKMDNVLIDDRRIHVDFSQSVAKVKWHGKGRGVTHYDDKGKKTTDKNNELGKGKYKYGKNKNGRPKEESKDKEDYKHTEKSKGHYGDRKNNRDYYGRNYQPYRHRQRNNSPHRNRRSRSPHKKDRSRSPKRRNRSKSPNKRNRSRSPVRKDRNRSPVQQKRRQDSKYRDDKHEKHKSRKEQKKYNSSSDFSDDDRKKKTKSSKKSKEEIKRKDHKGGRSKSSSDSDSEENIKNKKKKKKSRRRSSNSSSD